MLKEPLIFLCALCTLVGFATAEPLTISDQRNGSFIDATNGIALNIPDDGVVAIDTSVGNCVFPSGQILVGMNGGVGFGPGSLQILSSVNQPIPNDAAFGGGQAVLVFWDAFDDKDGDVLVNQKNGRLVIEWQMHDLDGNLQPRFQLQIIDNVSDDGIVAQLLYENVSLGSIGGGASATIGYQDGDTGFGDFQWSFNSKGAVQDGTVLSLIVPNCGTKNVPVGNPVTQILLILILMIFGLYGAYRANRVSASAGNL